MTDIYIYILFKTLRVEGGDAGEGGGAGGGGGMVDNFCVPCNPQLG